MATRSINVTVGNTGKDGKFASTSTAHSQASAAGDFSIQFDDTKINTLTKLRQVLDQCYHAARGNSIFTA